MTLHYITVVLPGVLLPATIISEDFFVGSFMLYSAVERAVFRSEGSLSAALSSFCYSRETHPPGSNSHDCLSSISLRTANEKRAKQLKPTLPTAVFGITVISSQSRDPGHNIRAKILTTV